MQMRDFLIDKIYKLAEKDKDVILISNEQGAQSLDKFRSDLPNQFINAGISEQNIISVAAGLSKFKKKVFIYSIASFITLRSFEQIKIDLNIMNLPVVIFGVGASCSYDTAGPTHHSIDDVSILRTLKNINLFSPTDNNVLENIFNTLKRKPKLSYLRLDRMNLNIISKKNIKIKNTFQIFGKKTKNAIISTGYATHIMNELRVDLLKKNINFTLIDIFQIKPLNEKQLQLYLKDFKNVIVVEEHTINGGIGSIISEIKSDFNLKFRLKRLGIKDKNLYTYNSRDKIYKNNQIDKNSIKKIIYNL
jgi:transketolase